MGTVLVVGVFVVAVVWGAVRYNIFVRFSHRAGEGSDLFDLFLFLCYILNHGKGGTDEKNEPACGCNDIRYGNSFLR
jgi:hypothetical protein